MQIHRDTTRWAEQMFGGCELGDARRTRRTVKLGAQLAAHAGQAPVSACRGDSAANEGAYRLLRNEAVAPEAIAEGGFQATVQVARGWGELLAVEDTTTLSYGHGAATQLGDLGGPVRSAQRGFHVHSVLLVEAHSGHTVGLIEQERWCRSRAARGQRHRRGQRAYEDKESFKWQRAAERVRQRLGEETMERVIAVCDREADVYEYLRYKCGADERFVVRAAQDRRVEGEATHLFEQLAHAPVVGTHTVAVAQRGGRRARIAELTLRAAQVTVHAPKRAPGLGPIALNAILAQEDEPPAGETPLCWLLLTSEAVDDLAAVCRVLHYYQLRWRVEEFHKAWKSGARVEHRRMHSADNLERIAVILAFIAVRLLQLREVFAPPAWVSDEAVSEANAQRARAPCSEVLTRTEWRVLWAAQERSRPPAEAPSRQWAYKTLANLGGWMDTKRTARAGWEVMWQGWFRLQERVDTYLAARDFLDEPEL